MQETETPPTVAEQPESSPASPGVTDTDLEGGASNPTVLDAVGAGTPEATAQSVEDAGEGVYHDAFLGLDSYGWVGLAFVIFAALLIYLKVPRMVVGALDARSARIRAELDEAKRLRAEAEALLGEYAARERQAERDSAAILANAHAEAAAIVAAAHVDAEARVVRRTRQAEDRIAAAERAAEAELRARVAAIATDAARRVIGEDAGPDFHARLADQSIGELDRALA